MVDGRPKDNTPGRNAGASGSTLQESAEAKRLEARRKFLLGGASAVPFLVTFHRAKAATISVTECVLQLGDSGLVDEARAFFGSEIEFLDNCDPFIFSFQQSPSKSDKPRKS